jgi:actin-like ATPase involved in cell morphogenesis
MGSFLKKGMRKSTNVNKKDIDKEAKNLVQDTITNMNLVMEHLQNDPELRDDNFLHKVERLTDFNFSAKQLNMLKRDLLLSYDE